MPTAFGPTATRPSDLEVSYAADALLSADLVTWAYDTDDRLTSEIRDSVVNTSSNDRQCHTHHHRPGILSDIYTYDLAGNRLHPNPHRIQRRQRQHHHRHLRHRR